MSLWPGGTVLVPPGFFYTFGRIMDKELFFECPYPGEMLPLERSVLYDMIMLNSDDIILEVGSGLGASTYYICEAIRASGYGKLFTCDPSRSPTGEFLEKYSDICEYHRLTSGEMIAKLINEGNIPSFIFFDGPEDPEIALQDIKTLEPHLKPFTVFGMHDWCTERRGYDGNISTKAALIKPHLDGPKSRWRKLLELSGVAKNDTFDDYNFDSVGMCFYILGE